MAQNIVQQALNNIASEASKRFGQFGNQLAQGEIQAEKNIPLYGQLQRGVRETVAPIIANFNPQAARQYRSFSQPALPGFANAATRFIGEQVPYIPLFVGTSGMQNPVTSKLESMVPQGTNVATRALSTGLKTGIGFAPYGLLQGLPATTPDISHVYTPQERAGNVGGGVAGSFLTGQALGMAGSLLSSAAKPAVKYLMSKQGQAGGIDFNAVVGTTPEEAVVAKFKQVGRKGLTQKEKTLLNSIPIERAREIAAGVPEHTFEKADLKQFKANHPELEQARVRLERFKATHPDLSATELKNLPEVPIVYRGTRIGKEGFDLHKYSDGAGGPSHATFFTDNVDSAKDFGFGSGKTDTKELQKVMSFEGANGLKLKAINGSEYTPKLLRSLQQQGYEGVRIVYPNRTDFAIFNPERLNKINEIAYSKLTSPEKFAELTQSKNQSILPHSLKEAEQGFVNFGAKVGNKTKQLKVKNAAQQIDKELNAGSADIQAALQGGQINSDEAQALGLKNILKERGFVTSVKNSSEVSPTVQGQVAGTLTPKPNAELLQGSTQLLKKGLSKATNSVMDSLSQTAGSLKDQAISDAIAVAKAHDTKGNFAQATQIYDQLATHLTEAGRQVQAASLLSNRTPQGLLYSAVATLKRAGVSLTPETSASLKGFIGEIKNTLPNSDARTIANQKLVQFINNKIPRSVASAGVDFWRAMLLSGPETVSKVAVSHLITSPFELASQVPAELLDRGMALVTGKRSMTATLRGAPSGFAEGLGAMGTKIKTGIDLPRTGGFESDFGNGTYQTPVEKFIYNLHGAIFKPTYGLRYKTLLYDQALTGAGNQGLSGTAKKTFIDNFVKTPPASAIENAVKDADIGNYQQRTQLGKFAGQLQKFKLGPFPIGKIITPFTRIPSAIGVNGLWNYTPLGVSSEVIRQVESGKFDQRTLAMTFGRSATGTTIAALGSLLAANGLLTLKAPSDAKERALWEAQGKTPNSVNYNGTWISLNSFGAVGLVMGIGGGIQQSLEESGKGNIQKAITDGLVSGGGMLLDQPYLKGISGLSKALNDPLRFGQSYFNNTLGSVVPAAIQQTARGVDTAQRMYPNDIVGKFKSEIPGLRNALPPQRDLYGNVLPGSNPQGTIAGGVIGTINPFYPSAAKSDPVTTELQRLYDALGSSGAPSIAQPSPNQTIGGAKIKLNQAQLSQYIASRGPQVYQSLTGLIQDPAYQALSDEEKTNAINSILTAINKNVRGTIDLNQTNQTAVPQAQTTGQYSLIGPTGTVKTINLSQPISIPKLTGSVELDKGLMSKYNAQLTQRRNDVIALYQAGKLTADEATQELDKLKTSKLSTGKGRKLKKYKLAKVKAYKGKKLKIKSPKLAKIKLFTTSRRKA